MKIDEYHGLNICGMHIPYIPIAESSGEGWKHSDISIEFEDKEHELPKEIEEYKKKATPEKEEAAKKAGKVFLDEPKVRLNKVRVENRRLYLNLSRTTYFSFKCSNRAVGEILDGRTIRESYVDENNLKSLEDSLANLIGVELGVVTSDNKIVLVKRSSKIDQYPSLYGVPAGFMDPTKDSGKVEISSEKYGKFSLRDIVSPFFTAERELCEEVLGKAEKEDLNYKNALMSIHDNLRLLGIGRAYDDLHVEISMSTKTEVDSKYIEEKSKFAPDKFENEGKPLMVSFNPKDVSVYLTKRINSRPAGTPEIDGIWIEKSSPIWVPAHWITVYKMLTNAYGIEEVNKELTKALKTEN